MDAPEKHCIDASEADFQIKVLEESKRRPVVVDFWAPWCGPCRTLGPVLEQEAKSAEGAFLLVKVNTDEAPALSQQMGIRGIPAVKAFVDGKIVDEFTGALPRTQVREFLKGLKKGPEDELLREALELAERGKLEDADQKARAALDIDAKLNVAWVVRAQAAVSRRAFDEAEQFLAKAEGDPSLASAIQAMRARASFVRAVDHADDEPTLRQRVEKKDDPDAALGLAAYEVLAGRMQDAFDRLLHVLTTHRKTHRDAAHKLILALLPLVDDAERGREMRKKLSAALY